MNECDDRDIGQLKARLRRMADRRGKLSGL